MNARQDDPTSRAIEDFWAYLRDHRREMESLESADDPAYDAILGALQKIDPGLYFVVSSGSDDREFIVTAEGDRKLFPLVEQVVAKAPRQLGWSFHALKPKLGFPEMTRWEGFTLRVADVVFDPLVSKDGSELSLCLHIPGLDPAQGGDAHNAVLRAIDSGLGERAFAEKIAGTVLRPLPAGSKAEDFIPLIRLEAFLDWRDKKRLQGGN